MSHVSFSEVKIWKECPWKHKLLYLDRIKGFEGNEYTAFGTAIHSTYEKVLLKEDINEKEHFQKTFLEELKALPEKVKNSLNKELVNKLRKQGDMLAPLSMDALRDYFGDFEVVSAEEQLYEPIKHL